MTDEIEAHNSKRVKTIKYILPLTKLNKNALRHKYIDNT